MAVSARVDVTLEPYTHSNPTADNVDQVLFLREELEKIEVALNEVIQSCPQVCDKEPSNPRRGLQRYAVSPWNPLGTGDGWCYYTGSVWAAL